MKKINLILTLISFLSFNQLFSQSPDTIHVIAQNKTHMGSYGSYTTTAAFPPDTNSYRKVLLNFTLGCPSGGCSQWDYTVDIYLNHDTHIKDSNLVKTPSFTVNGTTKDTVYINKDTTYTTYYDTTTHKTDSTANAVLVIVQYKDSLTPTTPSDTIKWWNANYYNYYYDSTGHKTDSILVTTDSTMYVKFYYYYHVYDSIESYEIARMITPYAGYYAKTWTYPYVFDVTDFDCMMHDSVQIEAFYSGYTDGFTATCDFEMITGTPPHKAYMVHPMWTGSFPYGNPSNPISNYLVPRPIKIDSNASAVRLRVLQTGHGEDVNNCTEFCANYNHILVNSKQQYSSYVWKDDCGLNPLYHQAGTWLYNRANWCPGEQITPYLYDLSAYVTPGKTDTILMSMDPYAPSSYGGSIYTIGATLIYYGPINYSLDASLDDIIMPTSNPLYSRMNPICDSPMVVIRNTGSTPLTSVDITYGQVGGASNVFHWTGTLLFDDTAVVRLPQVALTATTNYVFQAKVSNPNGGTDMNPDNDMLQTPYTIVPTLPADFIIRLITNNVGSDYSYLLTDELGNTIVQRSGLANTTTYRDTVHLAAGCYNFELYDSGEEGLSFWANTGQGNGSLTFTKIKPPSVLVAFQADFGTSIIYNFTVSSGTGFQELNNGGLDFDLYPNPATDKFTLSALSASKKEKDVRIYSAVGELVYECHVPATVDQYTINTSSLVSGFYFVEISNTDGTVVKKLTVVR